VETIIEFFYGFLEKVAGQKTRAFFPLVATFFFFILTSNWMGILPGYGSVGVWEEHDGERVLIPFLRSANAHWSTTLALALVSVVAAQYFGFKMLGLSYIGRFFRFNRLITPFIRLRGRKRPVGRSELIQFFLDFVIDLLSGGVEVVVGLLELASELIKILSFSVRLFGNIFAGEVLLIVISFLFTFVASLPFMGLELFVGFVQALIFAMLSLIFFMMATMGHGAEGAH
jgi:F-type H+-transporting ATPase subunit a